MATTTEEEPKKYIGSTNNFKQRYISHKYSFRHETHRNATTLSHHIWDQELGPEPNIKWQVLEKAPSYKKGGRACHLCLTEKLHIMSHLDDITYLNRRSELAAKCRHKAKFRLSSLR